MLLVYPSLTLRVCANSQAHYNTVVVFICCKNSGGTCRCLGQAKCCLSVVKGDENNELCFEEVAKGKYKKLLSKKDNFEPCYLMSCVHTKKIQGTCGTFHSLPLKGHCLTSIYM